jgi:hypothetical protein
MTPALVLDGDVKSIGRAFNKLTQIELRIHRVTGCIFVPIGIYCCLAYVFNVFNTSFTFFAHPGCFTFIIDISDSRDV